MSKSLHNLYRFLLHFFPSPLLMRKTSHLSFDMRFFLNALIAWSRLKRHVVIPPFLCCFPLISWAYLFVCKTHTANAKDLFAVGKTISVTHLFSCFLRFTSWLKCAAKMFFYVTYAQLSKKPEKTKSEYFRNYFSYLEPPWCVYTW